MSSIEYDPVALEGCISKLKQLYSDLSSAEVFPEGSGRSQTYTKMNEIYVELLAAQKSMLSLIELTSEALVYAKRSMVLADYSNANNMKSIG